MEPANHANEVPVGAGVVLTGADPLHPEDFEDTYWLSDQGEEVEFDVVGLSEEVVRLQPRRPLDFATQYFVRLPRRCGGYSHASRGRTIRFQTVVPAVVGAAPAEAAVQQMVEHRNWVYATSPSQHALSIYEHTAQGLQQLDPVELGGPSLQLAVHGDLLAVAQGRQGASLWQIGLDGGLELASRVELPGAVQQCAVAEVGGRPVLAAALGDEGVALVDLSQPHAPELLSLLRPEPVELGVDGPVSATGVALVEASLLVASESDGVFSYDISDLARPDLLSHGSWPRAIALHIAGDHGWVAAGPNARVLSFPLDSVEAATADVRAECLANACGLRALQASFARDSILFAMSQRGVRRVLTAADGGVVGLGPETELFTTPTSVQAVQHSAHGVLVGEVRGLSLYDDAGEALRLPDEGGLGISRGLASRGGLAYVAADFAGLQVFDLSSTPPSLVGRSDTPSVGSSPDLAARDVRVVGERAVVADGRSGIAVFDISSPSSPQLEQHFNEGIDWVYAARSVGDFVYLCNNNAGIEIIDLSSSVPARHSYWFEPVEQGGSIVCEDLAAYAEEDLLYMGDRAGLVVFDISERTAPRRLARLEFPVYSHVTRLARSRQTLYLMGLADLRQHELPLHQQVRVAAFSLEDPLHPELASALATSASGGELLARGPFLLWGSGEGIRFFRQDAPASFPLVYHVPITGEVTGLHATEQAVYVSQGARGLSTLLVGPLPAE